MSVLKKSISVLLSIVLLALMLTAGISVFASDSYKITVKSAQNLFDDISRMYKPGENFDLKYYIKADKKMNNGLVCLGYDNSQLSIPSRNGYTLGEEATYAGIAGTSNYNKDRFMLVYTSANGYVADFRTEGIFVTFHFKVSDSISSDQVITFDINGLYGVETMLNKDGDEVANLNLAKPYTDYIDKGVVLESTDRFSVRVEITGGTEVQPVTEHPVTPTETIPVYTSDPTESAASTAATQPQTTDAPDYTVEPSETYPQAPVSTEASTSPLETEPSQDIEASTAPYTEQPEATVKKTSISAVSKKALYRAATYKINAKINNAVDKTTYNSNNKSVAKVSASGKVTAIKKGKAVITIINNNVKKTVKITVKNPKLNRKKITLNKGKTSKLKVKGRVGKTTFKSSDKSVVKVSKKGILTAKKRGKAVITVKTNKGFKLKCKVKVN